MFVESIKKIRLFDAKKNSSLINLFTTGHCIDEIKSLKTEGRKIVCFGTGENSFFLFETLKEIGIGPDIITDNGLKSITVYLDNIPVVRPTELLREKEKYYFIVTLDSANHIYEIKNQLLLWGVEDFAIITRDITADFGIFGDNEDRIKNAYYNAFNKIYKNVDFTEMNFNNARLLLKDSICYWQHAIEWLLPKYGDKKDIPLLDVGPGSGIASLTYKELMDVSLNWINFESVHDVWMPSSHSDIIYDAKINVQYGNIETDDFKGKYDIILLTEVIEHFAFNPIKTMEKIRKMLTADGHLVLTTPNYNITKRTANYESYHDMPIYFSPEDTIRGGISLQKILGDGWMHVYEYKPEEIYEVLIKSGFEIVHKNTDCPCMLYIAKSR